jgi:hypothetical protein
MILVQRREDQPLGHEEKLVWQYATMEGVKVRAFSPGQLASLGEGIVKSSDLVVGSVASIEEALGLWGVALPSPQYYPSCLLDVCYRKIEKTTAGEAIERINEGQPLFVKSHSWKQMTGNVSSQKMPSSELGNLPLDTKVWVSNVVNWLSEYRVYVSDNKIIAICCYEGDEKVELDTSVLDNAISRLQENGWHDTYAMDWGVIRTDKGEHLTALVEMNDAWAIGAYAGIDYQSYSKFLMRRWKQLTSHSP